MSLMLNMIKALSQLRRPLQRSIVFVSLTAEEYGLLGSLYYAQHPILPLSEAVADINIDIANLYGETKDMVALGGDMSSLGKYVSFIDFS
jgi:Zn-dependent M28 family amino/carboxypeptidase